MSKSFTRRGLTMGQQVAGMASRYPGFQLRWRCGVATWTGSITPTSMSHEYEVSITYRIPRLPDVSVIRPTLRPRPDQAIPHAYSGPTLCLFLPGSGEWHDGMLIAETVVPWASLWLYYYEVWRATGEWLGGGVHPSARRPRRRA